MPPKLTKGSHAVQLLRNKFASGLIAFNDDAKEVHQSDPSFSVHKLSNFRTCYNNIRKEMQDADDAGSEGGAGGLGVLSSRCTAGPMGSVNLRKRRLDADGPRVLPDSDSEEESLMLPSAGLDFKPLYLVSKWSEPATMTRRVTVAVVLPSGVRQGGFSVRVADTGDCLDVTVSWPKPLVELETMHRKWLGDDRGFRSYHPKYVGFQTALRALRFRSSDNVESIARIRLPFKVETHIYNKSNLSFKDDETRMVYVDLKAVTEDYALENDDEEFELV